MASHARSRQQRRAAARRNARRVVADRLRSRRRRIVGGSGALVAAATAVVLVLVLGGGPTPYQQTTRHLFWSPPRSRTLGGHVYRLIEAPTSYRELLGAKAAVASYATSAWCTPVTKGLNPADPSIEGELPVGTPLVRELQAAPTVATTPTSAQGAKEDLVRLPVPSSGTNRWCTWAGNYPRVVAATGGHLDPTPGLAHPAYPAYYGRVVSEVVPVDIEYGWTDSAGRGVHAWASGDLTFTRPNGGHLSPWSWQLVSWWSSTTPVPGPVYLPPNHHWNYAGEPGGRGFSSPPNAVLAPGAT